MQIRSIFANPAQIFVTVGMFFGFVLIFIVPPFQSPDEYNHFYRAFQVSEGHWFSEKIKNNRLGGTLPVALDSLRQLFQPLKGDAAAKCRAGDMHTAGQLKLLEDERRFIDFPNTAIYAPTAYLPQAAGIFLARQFTDRVLLLFYGARFFNLLVWLALVWAAVRRMPFHRWVMATLALLPASLAIAASCNDDVLTNGLAFYLIAIFCRGISGNPASKFEYLGPLLLISVNKLVFAPFALLAGWQHRLDWKNSFRRSLFPLAGALVVASAWGRLANDRFVPYDRYDPTVRDAQTLNPGVDPPAQMTFVLEHPWQFAKIVAHSFVRAIPSMGAHWVGKFGWEKNYLPAWILALLWLALAGLVFTEENPLRPAQRLWLAAVILLSVALWAITMYALWCPVGATVIDNWQSRYFIPLGPLAALVVGVGWGRRWLHLTLPVALALLILGNLVQIHAVISRYFS